MHWCLLSALILPYFFTAPKGTYYSTVFCHNQGRNNIITQYPFIRTREIMFFDIFSSALCKSCKVIQETRVTKQWIITWYWVHRGIAENVAHTLNSQKTPHSSISQASYGMPIVRIFEKLARVEMGPYRTCLNCMMALWIFNKLFIVTIECITEEIGAFRGKMTCD